MASPVSSPSASRSDEDGPPLAHPPPLRRVARSFGFAFEGLGTLFRTQPNFVVHVVAAGLALVLGLVLRLSPAEFAIIVLTIGLVLLVESVNTALESVCDLVSPGYHHLIKRAKDVSAAAVLIAAITAVAVAALVYLPHLAGVMQR